MPIFSLWRVDKILQIVTDIEPRLASWNKKTDPAQIRLQTYLDNLMARISPLPQSERRLFLHLDVDVQQPVRLLRHYDLENYLTPLFGSTVLDPSRFAFVSAKKYVGGGSRLLLGVASSATDINTVKGWEHFSFTAQGSVQTKQWKENLRTAIAATHPKRPNEGAVEIQISLRCSPQRNWVTLWKPIGDCMGPILGEVNPQKPFTPNDDRIVSLGLHLNVDATIGHKVDIGMWWRSAKPDQVRA
ncbi:MAG: hypothetical protein NT075_34645 [Chloroflexi bacterium]|nr:hypothetical protein [Chloroflexota bacterium]